MKLQYAEDGSIAGGCQETFLLEKSRLVSQDHQEANFHIFYHLLAGASPEEREALHLGGEFECVVLSVTPFLASAPWCVAVR